MTKPQRQVEKQKILNRIWRVNSNHFPAAKAFGYHPKTHLSIIRRNVLRKGKITHKIAEVNRILGEVGLTAAKGS